MSHMLASVLVGLVWLAPTLAFAQVQPIGTFSWRMDPYCNTLTLTVVQDPAGIRLQGTEDLCDAVYIPQAVEGSVILASDGSAVVGLNTSIPGSSSVEGTRVVLRIDTTTLNGTWSDDAGRSGTLVRVISPRSSGIQRGGVPNTWVHEVSIDNRPAGAASNISCFSHPRTNGNADALIVFSHNRGAQSSIRPFVPSVVSLYFDDDGTGLPGDLANNVWCLSRNDSQPMPLGAGFTIRVETR